MEIPAQGRDDGWGTAGTMYSLNVRHHHLYQGKREVLHCHPGKRAAFIRDLRAMLIKLNMIVYKIPAQGRDDGWGHTPEAMDRATPPGRWIRAQDRYDR
ncbi:MAG: hypothetical protein GY770_34535 [Aestuariibacter sp.]|nr:hypothetical protein [Aestuariibacter sp.]